MEQYDVIIVGGSTTGSYLAHGLAARGQKVLVIEQNTAEKVGSKYDIFHIALPEFARFDLPMPVEGEDLAFRFTGSQAFSAFGHYPKEGNGTVIGMHMHAYTLRLNRWAIAAGAEYRYETRFLDLTYKAGRITGVKVSQKGEEKTIRAGLVADCSGIPSVVRTKLPDGYGTENFVIGPKDMFYVILKYVKYLREADYVHQIRTWTYYKTWEAPQADPHGAILGVGANFSFDFAQKIYGRFEKAIPLPERELQYEERGTTPYRRPPYSFVGDGFVALGDAACLTKPHAGEGVTSAMVQADLVIEVVDGLFQAKKPLTKENLWPINHRYYLGQGKVYAGMLATLVGAVATSPKENEFFFRHDIIFSAKSFAAMAEDRGLELSGKELVGMALKLLWGVVTFQVRIRTIRSLLTAMKNGDRITALYAKYPESAEGFDAWVAEADATWAKTPGMADVVDPEKD
jgi:flavin-dependent dehydrogenase